MNGEDLLRSLNHIDESWIQSAETEHPESAPRKSWLRLLPAACILLLVCGLGMGKWGRLEEFRCQADIADTNLDTAESIIETKPASGSAQQYPATAEEPAFQMQISFGAEGLTGTILQTPDAEVFPVGMELNLILLESDTDGSALCRRGTDETVSVEMISYDRETNTAVVCLLEDTH